MSRERILKARKFSLLKFEFFKSFLFLFFRWGFKGDRVGFFLSGGGNVILLIVRFVRTNIDVILLRFYTRSYNAIFTCRSGREPLAW